jgi:hypothetical protein
MKILLDPPETAYKYARLIREDRWDDIKADVLLMLLRCLSRDAKDNLDKPLKLPPKLSGAQARAALKELFGALTRSRRGPRKRATEWVADYWKQHEPFFVSSFFKVRGAPTRSLAEYRAFEATELLRARAEAHRRNRKEKWREVTAREIFRERILPRLGEWKDEDEDLSERVFAGIYDSALETIGLAGRPTERAIRAALGLTYRSARRKVQLRRLIGTGKLRLGEAIKPEALRARGLKVLGEKPHS